MKNFLIGLIIGIIIGGAGMFYLKKCTTEEVEVPVYIEVPVPSFGKDFDTIFKPKPLPVVNPLKPRPIDSTWYKKYQSLKHDSIKLDSLIKKMIEIKEYRETVEDDTISIDLYMEVRGELLKYQTSYKTNPFTIPVDTTIKVKVPKSPEFYMGLNLTTPYKNSELKPSIGPQINYINKEHKINYNIKWDPFNETIDLGATFRF